MYNIQSSGSFLVTIFEPPAEQLFQFQSNSSLFHLVLLTYDVLKGERHHTVGRSQKCMQEKWKQLTCS